MTPTILDVREPRCETCLWAKDNNLPGWKLCTFPLPPTPRLPYWAFHRDMWTTMPVDVEDDDTDCATWEARP